VEEDCFLLSSYLPPFWSLLENTAGHKKEERREMLPFLVTQRDDKLLGTANRSDAMGLLSVWSARARDIVPYLTEQTTDMRAFQLLIEGLRLWEVYERTYSQHVGRVGDFFLLFEQAVARSTAAAGITWELPGARRVNSRPTNPAISLNEYEWHLLRNQLANGIWGLYRGAAIRAGLLDSDGTRLSQEVFAKTTPLVTETNALFKVMKRAMEGEVVYLSEFPSKLHSLSSLSQEYTLAPLLWEYLIEGHELNRQLALRLLQAEDFTKQHYRNFLSSSRQALPEHEVTLRRVSLCENLLSVLEELFFWLCASKGDSLAVVADSIPLDLAAFRSALQDFQTVDLYRDSGSAASRHHRICDTLRVSSKQELLSSILELHQLVSKDRGRAPWVWEEDGHLRTDVTIDKPAEESLLVGYSWRNSYYLSRLHQLVHQLVHDGGVEV
jgi:hypothetical protein